MVAPYKPYQNVEYLNAMRPLPPQWGGGHMQVMVWRRTQDGTKQAFPHTTDTSYVKREYDSFKGLSPCDSWTWSSSDPFAQKAAIAADNQAYKKFVGKLGDSSSFGATIVAERRETWGTVVNLITRALTAAKCAKRLDPRGVASALGLPYRERTISKKRWTHRRDGSRKRAVVSRRRYFQLPTGRWVLKSVASCWLLFSYGIKPVAQDIYNGMDVLQRPLPFMKVNARGRSRSEEVKFYDGNLIRHERSFSAETRCSANVSVNNPNLWLCNQMGLVNPVQWLLEAIPLSFVADWFSNLSEVVNSMTDFVGLDIAKPCTTWLYLSDDDYLQTFPPSWGYGNMHDVKQRSEFWRYLQLPQVTFQWAYERFNWQRGANAISLLIGLLPRR